MDFSYFCFLTSEINEIIISSLDNRDLSSLHITSDFISLINIKKEKFTYEEYNKFLSIVRLIKELNLKYYQN